MSSAGLADEPAAVVPAWFLFENEPYLMDRLASIATTIASNEELPFELVLAFTNAQMLAVNVVRACMR